ncbi:30S ribosomal protein S20 [Xylocopilactobacillus apicola]|uniref:Small ribosomal subunit protein bS20 n=1 Tax=Xylocopilactobacillus apicola TaxID=2932184 RepID=A0AAU9D359_9LACO|nr:30S ribosomal protein S20 [Xylocopilactobacillus apicola]BDR59256.1 30S ribosomal protein S20 [Xylocopilactobacillus apicola]
MPQIKSAIKRVKTQNKRRLANNSQRSEMRTAIKKFNNAAAKGEKDQIEVLYKNAAKLIDSAKHKKLIHSNKAARDLSKITLRKNSL